MKAIRYVMAICLLLIASTMTAQEVKQKIEMDIDSIGNAKIIISMDMNASQWQTWIQTLGNNPAALKREIQRSMPAYFLDDFDLKKDDMSRSFQLSLNAYGVCSVDKTGKWKLDTDEKGAELTALGNGKYMYVNSPQEFGGAVQQTTLVSFPEAAQNIEVDEDAYGKTLFKFDMRDQTRGINWLRWGGIFLILFSAIWMIIKMVR